MSEQEASDEYIFGKNSSMLLGKRRVLVGNSVYEDAEVTIHEGIIYIEFDDDSLDEIALNMNIPTKEVI